MTERDAAWASYCADKVVTAVEVLGELYPFKTIWDAAWAAARGNQAS